MQIGKFLLFVMLTSFLISCSSTQSDYPIQPVDFTSVKITDNFWAPRIDKNRNVSIPNAFYQCETTGRIDNFALAGGLIKGEHKGDFPFDDTDVYKVIEGSSYSLAVKYDKKLDNYLDSLITLVAAGQEDDGYLYTARTNGAERLRRWMGEKRWERVNSHELYNCGHLYEAAVAHYKATGKRSLLNVALKNADLIAKDFGPNEGQVHQPSGHPIIEMGLVKLYRVTGESKYLELANYFIEEAGRGTDGRKLSEYSQDHKPVVDQDEAVGHAVRFGYFYSGITDVAALTQNEDYINTINRVWENVTDKKLYITGGIGAREWGEGFGENYELPNMTDYCETCAAIANVYWNHRMFLLFGNSKYIDVLERDLYNNVLSGISLSGDHFFYDNPLESTGIHKREKWFGCACCPSNVTRFMASVPGYVYAVRDNDIYVNLFIGSRGEITLTDQKVELVQETDYPWQGKVKLKVTPEQEKEFALKIRIPGWLDEAPLPGSLYEFLDKNVYQVKINVNGTPVEYSSGDGYAVIDRVWKPGDYVDIDFPMSIRKILANDKVIDDRNKFALQIGPIIYCAEGIDNNNSVLNMVLPEDNQLSYTFEKDLLNGVNVIKGSANKITTTGIIKEEFTAVPYYAWNNRGQGEMAVWFPYNKNGVTKRTKSLASDAEVKASSGVGGYGPNDGFEPKSSKDKSKFFFYWWTKKGSEEWIEYSFNKPVTTTQTKVYWMVLDHYDGNFRVPENWKLEYKDKSGNWLPVVTSDNYSVDIDKYNIINHKPVTTTGLRISAKLQKDNGAGILEWQVF